MADTPATRVNGAALTSLVTCPVPAGAGGLWWDGNTTGPKWRKADGSDITIGGAGSTGNWTFSGNAATLTGAGTATIMASVATGLTIGGSNLTSGYTITGAAASTVTTTSGGLTLSAAGTVNVQSSSGAAVIGNTSGILTIRAGSTGSFDMSAASGVFKSSTGAHTFGSASWAVPANLAVIGATSALNTVGISFASNVNDGASSVVFDINNGVAISNATADMLRIRNNGTSIMHFRLTSSDGMKLVDGGGSCFMSLSTNIGASIQYGSNGYFAGLATLVLSGGGAVDGGVNAAIAAVTGQTAAGGVALRLDQDANLINNPCYGITTAAGIFAETGTYVNVSGTVAVGDVCVWVSGTANTVSKAGATNNLTTIAGISTAAQTGGKMYLITRGRALVNAQAGVTVGQLVGTSSATAGTVQSGTAPTALGSLVGRALESTGATTASKVTLYVTL